MKNTYYTFVILTLSISSLFLCIWIELLNNKHGNYLPRKDIYTEANNNKWRDLSTQAAEKVWRKEKLGEIRTENYPPLELTREQEEHLNEFLDNNHSRIFFHDLVRFSLALYLLLPTFSSITIYTLINSKERKQKAIFIVALVSQVICFYLMFTRGLFSAIIT